MKKNFIVQAWLVIVMSLCFGASLAGVQMALADRIEQNKVNKTMLWVPKLIEGAIAEKTKMVVIDGKEILKAFDSSGEQVGWVIKAKGVGYGGDIEILIGVNVDCSTIMGISVLKHTETPALGDKITELEFRDEFAGKSTGSELKVNKDGGMIKAISAATVSSRSVCGIVNGAVSEWKGCLAEYESD